MSATLQPTLPHPEPVAAPAARLTLNGIAATDEALDPDEAWEYEGGAIAVSAAVPEQPSRASRLIVGM